MGIALGTIPSTAGGRPPEARLTTPGGYLWADNRREQNILTSVFEAAASFSA